MVTEMGVNNHHTAGAQLHLVDTVLKYASSLLWSPKHPRPECQSCYWTLWCLDGLD